MLHLTARRPANAQPVPSLPQLPLWGSSLQGPSAGPGLSPTETCHAAQGRVTECHVGRDRSQGNPSLYRRRQGPRFVQAATPEGWNARPATHASSVWALFPSPWCLFPHSHKAQFSGPCSDRWVSPRDTLRLPTDITKPEMTLLNGTRVIPFPGWGS